MKNRLIRRATYATMSGALRPPERLRWPGGVHPFGVVGGRLVAVTRLGRSRGFCWGVSRGFQLRLDALQGGGQEVILAPGFLPVVFFAAMKLRPKELHHPLQVI